ncbi:MAG: chemotaxis protein [Fusobacteriaceae bacterium]|jgi:hypothetical protein|nr:chemotaxis protein [Fusobacteriaceae bacterium]
MDVYIDNVKVDMGKEKFSSFGLTISAITKRLHNENRVLDEIFVNGETLKENSYVNLESLKTLEITTRSFREIVLESLYSTREYIDNYFYIIDRFFEGNEDEEVIEVDEEDLFELLSFLHWFYNLILIINENFSFQFAEKDFSEFVEEFSENLDVIEGLYHEEDCFDLIEALESSIGQMLLLFYDNFDECFNEVIFEEKKKNLLI